MKVSKKCLDLVKKFEGFRSEPYLDAIGIPTIGYGNTFHENGTKVTMDDDAISEEDALKMLETKLNKFCSQIEHIVETDLSQNQVDALTSFAYNVGIGNLKSSSLLRKLNSDDVEGAAQEFLKWNKAGGKVLDGLTRRRESEKELFLS